MSNNATTDFDSFEWSDEELAEIEKWENRELGADERFVRVVPKSVARQVDETLGFETISLRLQQSLMDEIQMMAEHKGIRAQTWIRIALTNLVSGDVA